MKLINVLALIVLCLNIISLALRFRRRQYLATVMEDAKNNKTICGVQIGKARVLMLFPTNVLDYHRLDSLDTFYWKPNSHGPVKVNDIIPFKRISEILNEPPHHWDEEAIRALVNKSTQDG